MDEKEDQEKLGEGRWKKKLTKSVESRGRFEPD